MRRTLSVLAGVTLFCLCAALSASRAEIAPPGPSSPACPAGYVCLLTADAAALYDEVERLEGENARLQRLARRWGGTVGGQGGISPWDGTPYAGIGYCWGWRTQR